jgi:hypothetical protein
MMVPMGTILLIRIRAGAVAEAVVKIQAGGIG